MPRFPIALCLCTALVVVFPPALLPRDWPHWGGDGARNMASPEQCPLPESFDPGERNPQSGAIDPATTRNVKWTAQLGTRAYGNPVVSDGKVFVGTNDAALSGSRVPRTKGGLVLCLDEVTGAPLWQLPIPRFDTPDKNFNYDDLHLGICAAAAVEGDRLYVLSNRGEALCLDADGQADGNDGPFLDEGRFMTDGEKDLPLEKTDGDIVWRFDMVHDLPVWPQDASSGAPLLHGDFLYVSTSNGVDKSHCHVPCPDAPSLIVLEKRTGRLAAWDEEKIGRRLYHGQWSSPAKGETDGRALIFYGAGDGILYAFEALKKAPKEGTVAGLKKVWAYDCNPPDYKVCPDGTPILYQRISGPEKNDTQGEGPSEIIATPVFHEGRVYVAVGHDTRHGPGKGILTCVEARTGAKVWESKEVGRTLSTVSISDGLLYIADYGGKVFCFDAADGTCFWRYDTQSHIWGSTFVADNKVYIGTENKELHVLRASKEMIPLARVSLRFPIATTPILANGVLYVASEQYLYAVEKQSTGEMVE